MTTYDKAIEGIQNLGYEAVKTSASFTVYKGDTNLARVDIDEANKVEIVNINKIPMSVWFIISDLTKTPINLREDTVKHYQVNVGSQHVLVKNKRTGVIEVGQYLQSEYGLYDTLFTKEEIENLKDTWNIDWNKALMEVEK